MTRLVLPLLALALSGLAAGPASAQSAETREDVRCLVALGMMQQSPDQDTRDKGVAAALYYLGRMDGREPSLDLAKALTAAGKELTAAEVGPLLIKCGGLISERGEALTKAADGMKAAADPK